MLVEEQEHDDEKLPISTAPYIYDARYHAHPYH